MTSTRLDPLDRERLISGNVVFEARLIFIAVVIYQVILWFTGGIYHFNSLLMLIAVIVLPWMLVLLPRRDRTDRGRRGAIEIAGAGLMLQGSVMILVGFSGYFVPRSGWDARVVLVVLACMLIVGSSLLCTVPWVGKRGIWILAGLHLFLGCWAVWLSPKPFIDVYLFHQESAAALLHGINPYSITFHNMYLEPDGSPSKFYSLEVQKGDRVMFGFPYAPLSLLAYLPSYMLTSESRYAHALATSLCGLLIGTLGKGRLAKASGILLLTAPATFHIIVASWTEPFLLLALVLTAVVSFRFPKWMPVALAMFFVMKQYTIIYLPLVWLILPRPLAWGSSIKFLTIMAICGAAVSLPLALWDWNAFWNSAIHIQMIQPFRFDALSYLAMVANAQPPGFVPPGWWSSIAFMLLIPTWIVLLWRLPRNMAGFVLGVGLVSLVFLFANRQAFINYHSFAAGTLLLYVAIREHECQTPVAA